MQKKKIFSLNPFENYSKENWEKKFYLETGKSISEIQQKKNIFSPLVSIDHLKTAPIKDFRETSSPSQVKRITESTQIHKALDINSEDILISLLAAKKNIRENFNAVHFYTKTLESLSEKIDSIHKELENTSLYFSTLHDVKKNELEALINVCTNKKIHGGLLVYAPSFWEEKNDYTKEYISSFLNLKFNTNFNPLGMSFLCLKNIKSMSEQIALILYSILKLLDSLPNKTQKEIDNINIEIPFSSNYLHETAKIRALKNLLLAISSNYKTNTHFHLQAALSYEKQHDSLHHLFSFTTQLMAAFHTGCRSIIIPSPTNDSDFINTITCNIVHLLEEESHINKVNDPASGSFYIEALTTYYQETAWKTLSQLINIGNIQAAKKEGILSFNE